MEYLHAKHTHLIRNRIDCHWLSSCELLNLHIKLLLDAIFQRCQYVIILLLQRLYDCSFHICNGLSEIIKAIAKFQRMQEYCVYAEAHKSIQIWAFFFFFWGEGVELTFSRINEYWGHLLIITSYWIRASLIFSYISSANGEVEWFVMTPHHGTCIINSNTIS